MSGGGATVPALFPPATGSDQPSRRGAVASLVLLAVGRLSTDLTHDGARGVTVP